MKEIGFYQPCHKKQYNGTTTDKRLPDLFSVLLPNHRHQIQVDKQVTERGKVMTENTAEGRQKQYRPQGLTVQTLPQEISGQSADGNSKHRPGIHSVVHTDLHHCRCQAYHDHIKGCCLRSPLPADHNRPQQHGQYRSQQCKHFVGNNAVSCQKRPQPQSHIPYRHIRIMGRQYHANDSHHRIVMGGAITVCFIIVDPLTETQGEQYRRAQNEDQP